ncbi:MAG: 3-oxoacyl-ACP reductase FabG [Parachlamydia sp.]|jgi:3-oxoacyl-[acyl-carrier protein] reductase|nr:3-oxoacyl-ACP reductase FabG [Parachlamydia sp.]
MNKLLADQVAVITGGNAGIGKAIALKFAFEGAKVAILGTNLETGQAAVKEITALEGSSGAEFYQVDVSDTVKVNEVLQTIHNKRGRVDILVNNAGVTADQLLMKMSEEDWDKVMAVNLKSCYNTCRSVVRGMMKARKGRIINISSVVGVVGNAGQVNYAASKAGMIGLTKALAKEVASRGILVNCVAPGFITTKMTEGLTDAQKDGILREIPLGKMGQPSDIANMVWFLASPLADYITGQVFCVDGGMVM